MGTIYYKSDDLPEGDGIKMPKVDLAIKIVDAKIKHLKDEIQKELGTIEATITDSKTIRVVITGLSPALEAKIRECLSQQLF